MGLGPDMFIKPIVMGMMGPTVMDFVQKMGNYAASIVPARINEFMVAEFAGPTPLSIFFMIIDLLDMIIGALQMAFAMALQIKMLVYNTARNAIMQANLAKAQATAMVLAAKQAAQANLLMARMQAIAVMNMVKSQMLAAKAAAKAAAMAARAQVIAGMQAARAAAAAAASQARAAAAMASAMKSAVGDALDSLPRPQMPQLPSLGLPQSGAPPGAPPPPAPAESAAPAASGAKEPALAAARAGAAAAAQAASRTARSSAKLRALAEASSKAAAAASAVVAAAQSPAVPATTRTHMATVAARASRVQERAAQQARAVADAAEALDGIADQNARAAIAAAQEGQALEAPPAPPPPPPTSVADVGRAAAAAAERVVPAALPPDAAAEEEEGGAGAGQQSWYEQLRAVDFEQDILPPRAAPAAAAGGHGGGEADELHVDAASLLQELEALHERHAAAARGRLQGGLALRSGRPVLVDVALALRAATRQVADASAGLEEELAAMAAEGLTPGQGSAALAAVHACGPVTAALLADPAEALPQATSLAFSRASAAKEGELRHLHSSLAAFLQVASSAGTGSAGPSPDGHAEGNGASDRRRRAAAAGELDAADVREGSTPVFAETAALMASSTRAANRFSRRHARLQLAQDVSLLQAASGAALEAVARSAARSWAGLRAMALAALGTEALEAATGQTEALLHGAPQLTMTQIVEHKAGPDWEEMGQFEQLMTKLLKPDASVLVSSVMTAAITQDIVEDSMHSTWQDIRTRSVPHAMAQIAMGTSLAVTAGVGYATSTALLDTATPAVLWDTQELAARALSTQIAGALTSAVSSVLGPGAHGPAAAATTPLAGVDIIDNEPACRLCAREPGRSGFAMLAGYLAQHAESADAKELKPLAEGQLKTCDECSLALARAFTNSSAEALAYGWVRSALVPAHLREAWLGPKDS